MKRAFVLSALAAFALALPAWGQTAQAPAQHLVGEVTAVDAAAGRFTVKTVAGESRTVAVDDKTTFRRLPPGETTLDKAERVTRADVQVGDRVLIPNGMSAGEAPVRQLIVMSGAGLAAQREREREERQRRTLVGRVAAVDAAAKQLTVFTRGREGQETVTINAPAGARFLRYAADSARAGDARPGSFDEVKVGDQMRATGERSADGRSFAAEEILSGSFTRVVGSVASVDAARGEVTVRNEQTGQTFTVATGQRTMLRRIPEEFAREMAARRQQAEQRRAARAQSGGGQQAGRIEEEREQRRRERAEQRRADGEGAGDQGRGPGGGRRGGFGGGNLQQALERMPAITLAELKKGDAVIVTATPGATPERVTAVALVTGDAEVLRSFGGRGGDDPRGLSPGLPGDVMGGGTGNTGTTRDQPK